MQQIIYRYIYFISKPFTKLFPVETSIVIKWNLIILNKDGKQNLNVFKTQIAKQMIDRNNSGLKLIYLFFNMKMCKQMISIFFICTCLQRIHCIYLLSLIINSRFASRKRLVNRITNVIFCTSLLYTYIYYHNVNRCKQLSNIHMLSSLIPIS